MEQEEKEPQMKKGGISVETQNIFPIIKKWLYSEKEIFLRELISNANDAITKRKRLISLGEAKSTDEPYRITVTLDEELGTLSVSDNGLGMDEGEVDRYINQIALSGAADFIQKYESSGEDNASGIIGHFGLGFYSAFMVADRVDIDSKSYTGAPAVHWTGNESGEYEMGVSQKEACGTDITLHLNEDEKEFLSAYKIREILEKYCAFMPIEIYFVSVKEQAEKAQKKDEASKEEPKPINDTSPLWQKKPSDCTKEEYNEFYHKVFHDYRDPLFYIHINADYPLNFKGILYFPPTLHEYDSLEGQVKLFYNQVFVADNIKEVIPEYMVVLKGVLDCPDLPLNVSRSYLQTNGYVNKISAHIVKKFTDKLQGLFQNEREYYGKIWPDIKPFVEYGCMKDEKFYTKVKDILLFKTANDETLTQQELLETPHFDKTLYYTDDPAQQSRYVELFRQEGIPVLVLDRMIDAQFISFLEQKFASSDDTKDIKFMRVDSGLAGALKQEDGEVDESQSKGLGELFRKALGKDDKFKVECAKLKDPEVPAVLNLSEEERRFADMMKRFGGAGGDKNAPKEETLVLNTACPLTEKLAARAQEDSENEMCLALAKEIYLLALVAQRQLAADELKSLLSDSAKLLERLSY